MDGRFALVCLAAIAAFAAAVCACNVAFSIAETRIRSNRVLERSGPGGWWSNVLRNGIKAVVPLSSKLLAVKRVGLWCEDACALLRARSWESTPESVCSIVCSACACALAVGVLIRSLVLGVALAACLAIGLATVVTRESGRRSERIREALPNALRAMGVCFHAGFTLQQTFDQLQKEAQGPIAELFAQTAHDMQTGSSAREALEKLRGTQRVPELSFVSVALTVQHQTGGSMQNVLDATCDSLKNELELRQSLRVHTAQARLSARVVVGVSVALVAVLSLLSKDFLAPFFQSALGLGLLAIAIAMQVAGIFIVRRMLRVEVD